MEIGLAHVREVVADAARRSGRSPDAIELVAVSKQRSDEAVRAAYTAGQRLFGENRQQGLEGRLGADLPGDIEWHFIGPLQSRKARFVATHAALVQSFDRERLVSKWPDDGCPVLLQFNMGDEPQKGGFAPTEWEQAVDAVAAQGIKIAGVMAIPPVADDPQEARPYFAALRAIYDELRDQDRAISVCSMGMSNDYAVAIEEGATMVRVGTAIFEPHT